MTYTDFSHRKNQYLIDCSKLSLSIKDHEKQIIDLLTDYETHEAARDEIVRSLEALEGMQEELDAITNPLENLVISTIFPLNLPLYSLIIFGVAPSVFASNIYIRPPEVMQLLLSKLVKILNISELFPAISLQPTPRHIFIQLYASESDVIIFTGKYENALQIHRDCPQALLIYNGSGVNPFILFENGDVELAAHKAVEMRCFNSGQDCAGPDAFFVPSSRADDFVSHLSSLLAHVKVGSSKDPDVRVSRTMKSAYVQELQAWLVNEKQHIVWGGKIEAEHHLVHPTIVRKKIEQHTDFAFHEFFAPYFYVIEYDDVNQLDSIIDAPAFRDRGMYVSVFGNDPAVEAKLTFVQLLRNVIVNDVERGNQQYGGFGVHANFLLYGDVKHVHPVLISRDMHKILS